METIIGIVESLTGLSPEAAVAAIGAVVAVANLIGKAIPDHVGGPLAVIRKIAKVVGLYITNKA